MALDDMKLADPGLYKEPPRGLVSFAEYLAWCADTTRAEWVDGRVILLEMTVQERHEAIRGLLFWLFLTVGRMTGAGQAYGEPFKMGLTAQGRSRMPDVFFLLDAHRDRLRQTFLDGPADIVVEVVSPESEYRDRVEKLADYERARVPEYWLIDHVQPRVEFRVLGPDGRYQIAFAGQAGEYHSSVLPALRLRVEWLWQDPPGRDLAEILRFLGLA